MAYSQVYIKASDARRAVRESFARNNEAQKLAADLREVQQEKAHLMGRPDYCSHPSLPETADLIC
jgi:hypothetical protein